MLRIIGFFLLGVLTLILFSALGIGMGILAVFAWIRLESTGIFVRWKLLDSPHKFQHLMSANEIEVLAQAEDGNYYLYYSGTCDTTTDRKCGQWVEWPPDQELHRFRNTIVESECKFVDDYYTNDISYNIYAKPRYPPQKESALRECVISEELHPMGAGALTYYVLLENGKVWKWIYKPISMGYLLHAVLGALVGLLIGIIIWIRFQKFLESRLNLKYASHQYLPKQN